MITGSECFACIHIFKLGDTICERYATDVIDAASGCSVIYAVMSSWGKYKLIPVLYTDIGDPAAATNVDKAVSIGVKCE